MFTILKAILWIATFFGFFGWWKPFKVEPLDLILKYPKTQVVIRRSPSSSEKHLKSDAKKICKALKKYHFLQSKLPISYIEYSFGVTYSRSAYNFIDKKEAKDYKNFIPSQNPTQYIMLAGIPRDVIVKLNETLLCSYVDICGVEDYISTAYMDHLMEDIENPLVEPCEEKYGWNGDESCDSEAVDLEDGTCTRCSTFRLTSKQLKAYRKSLNKHIDTQSEELLKAKAA